MDSRFDGHWRQQPAWPSRRSQFSYLVSGGVGVVTAKAYRGRPHVGEVAFRLDRVAGNRFTARHTFLITFSIAFIPIARTVRFLRVTGTIKGDTMRMRRGRARVVMVRDQAEPRPPGEGAEGSRNYRK